MTVLPQLRIGVSVLFGVVLIIAAFFVAENRTVPLESAEQTGIVAVAPREQQDVKDTDGDGLLDWEERLAGTDPLKPAPFVEVPAEGASSTPTVLSNTVTDRFARDFFEEMVRKSEGGQVSDEDQNFLIQSNLDGIRPEVADTPFTYASIHTTPDVGAESLREYGNALGLVMLAFLNPQRNAREQDIKVMGRAVSEDDEALLAQLDVSIAEYAAALDSASALTAPTLFANEHLNLLNALLALHNDTVAMRNTFADPLPALLRVQEYPTHSVAFANILERIAALFVKENVSFRGDEPGGFFLVLAQQAP